MKNNDLAKVAQNLAKLNESPMAWYLLGAVDDNYRFCTQLLDCRSVRKESSSNVNELKEQGAGK